MYPILKNLHSGWAYLVLLFLVIAVLSAWIGVSSKKIFTKKDRTIALIALIATHLQLVIGLIVYFVSPLGLKSLGNMADADVRLTSLEHPLINIIAIVLITVGWSTHKKALSDSAKFKKIAIFYSIGLVLILSRIPWKLWM